jgi:hypothetical protein
MGHDIFSILALDHPDWTIPWAGVGAVLLGLGSALSGYAAIMTARSNIRARERENEEQQQNNDIGSDRVDDGSGERVSGSDSIEPGISERGSYGDSKRGNGTNRPGWRYWPKRRKG